MAWSQEELVEAYNSLRGDLPKCAGLDIKQRQGKIPALMRRITENQWIDAVLKASKSDILLGKKDRFTKVNFDWFLNPDNVLSILEGTYDNPKDDRLEAPMRPAAEQTSYWDQPKPPALIFSRSQMAVVKTIGEEMLAEERKTKKKVTPTQDQLRRLDAAWDPSTGTKRAHEWLELMMAAKGGASRMFSDIWSKNELPRPEKVHVREAGSTDEDAPF